MVQANNYHHGDLRNALIQGGLAILLAEGVDRLTLRKAAKICQVSHNAPYRAFKNKDEFLMAIGQEIFTELTADILEIIQHSKGNPDSDFRAMMQSFFDYAFKNPIKYRFITSNFLSNEGKYENLTDVVMSAFATVRDFLEHHKNLNYFFHEDSDSMAILFISTIHGFCSIVIENKFDYLKGGPIDYYEQLNFIIEQLLQNLKSPKNNK